MHVLISDLCPAVTRYETFSRPIEHTNSVVLSGRKPRSEESELEIQKGTERARERVHGRDWAY